MDKKGIALIMAVGVLALLAIIATSFALNMRLEYHAAMNYYNGVKARYFAESALERAIAELREDARTTAFDHPSEEWEANGYSNDGSESGVPDLDVNLLAGHGASQTLSISDEQRKINTNMDTTTARLLLNNLVAILKGQSIKPKLDNTEGTAIMDNRPSGAGYRTLREILPKLPTSDTYPRKDRLADLKTYLTTSSYLDPNTAAAAANYRAPININTADQEVIAAVIMNVANTSSADIPVDVSTIPIGVAWQVADHIISYENRTGGTSSNPITSWAEFDDVIQSAFDDGHIDSDQATVIKYNCNPNRPKPTTHTTEFCFNSGGYYNVAATGSVTESIGFITNTLSTRTLSGVVKIYGIYCETAKAQFEKGSPARVTWLDSCPVDSTDLFGQYAIPSDAQTITNAIKLGYWDNFDENNAAGTSRYALGEWAGASGSMVFKDADSDGDAEITEEGSFKWPKYVLSDAGKWTWSNFSLSVFCYDMTSGSSLQMREVGQVMFRGTAPGNPVALHARDGNLTWVGSGASATYAYETPTPGSGTGEVEFLTDSDAADIKHYSVPADRYDYAGQIRIWPGPPGSSTNAEASYDKSTHRTPLAYSNKKTYNIFANGSNVVLNVYTSSSSASFTRTDVATNAGNNGLYGQGCVEAWDDIRIISPDGNFKSQTIDSTLIPDLANGVEWGTITGTLAHPASAVSNNLKGDIKLKTDITGTTTEASLSSTTPFLSLNNNTATSIQYTAFLAQNSNDSNIRETPILEDVTITYLPKVAIKSYSLSQ